MTATVNKARASVVPVAWENPLIPNKKLRALYVAMIELRLLDEHLSKVKRWAGAYTSSRGEEGCRVSTTFDLKSRDLTSEADEGLTTSFLRGAKLVDVLHRASAGAGALAARSDGDTSGQLPALADPIKRLYFALGAALGLAPIRQGASVIVYVHHGEGTLAEWKLLLRLAAANVLPILFVVLPARPPAMRVSKPGQLSLASSKSGVPGIPVDAADPVALFRVAQESMLRVRAGGGRGADGVRPVSARGPKGRACRPHRHDGRVSDAPRDRRRALACNCEGPVLKRGLERGGSPTGSIGKQA